MTSSRGNETTDSGRRSDRRASHIGLAAWSARISPDIVRRLGLFWGLAAWLMILGCFGSAVATKYYYLLTFPMPEKMAEGKYNITLRVKDFGISSTFNRSQIVFRYSLNELEYYNYRLWTEKPNLMISDLVRRAIGESGLAARVTRKLEDRIPEYTLSGDVDAIEELDSDNLWYAHLAMHFYLQKATEETVVWKYSFDERREVRVKEPKIIVRTLSEILERETRKVITGLDAFLSGRTPESLQPAPTPLGIAATATPTAIPTESAPAEKKSSDADSETQPNPTPGALKVVGGEAVTGPHDTPWLDSDQILDDTTVIPAGKGAIFVPALGGKPAREPVVIVRRDGQKLLTGQMGTRIVLEPGEYSLRFGSGTLEQLQSCRAQVVEQRITVIEPFWSSLDVRVVDEHFIPFRGSYELIAIPARTEYGIGFGADEERAEETKVWVLPPGMYKIVMAGGTYRDRINFSTVYLKPGELTTFTLVQDKTSGAFLGAGVIEEEQGTQLLQKWKFRALLGGDLLFLNQTAAGTGDLEGWTVTGNVFLDSMANFRSDRHQMSLRFEIEEGYVKKPKEATETLNDRLYFHSIYTYFLRERFGPYVRGGVESALTRRYFYFENKAPHTVSVFEPGQDRGYQFEADERVLLGKAFSPVQFKEGFGGNITMFNTEYLDLDVRLGLGARQYLSRGLLTEVSESDNEAVFNRVDDYSIDGIEASVVGFGRITRYIGWSFEFDSLFPLDKPDDYVYTLRNVMSIRLVSFASLNYKLDLIRDPNVNPDHPTVVQHQFLIRFSYTLF